MKWLAVVLAIVAGGYWLINRPAESYRYRITIEVDTSDGVKTGSSVMEAKAYEHLITTDAGSQSTKTTGEAVFVDLGRNRNLVALLALEPSEFSRRASFFAPLSFLTGTLNAPLHLAWARQLATMTGRRVFAGPARPILVSFASLDDPSTVRRVSFDQPGHTLGADVLRIRSWIEITRDPVTGTLKSKMPWIDDFRATRTVWDILGGVSFGYSPLQIFRLKGE